MRLDKITMHEIETIEISVLIDNDIFIFSNILESISTLEAKK